jgi:type IV pilus assembly protein PilM
MAGSSYFSVGLGSQRVTAAVFSKDSKGGLILNKFAVQEMEGDPMSELGRTVMLGGAVKELTKTLKASGSKAWFSLPGHSVFTRFVKVPPVAKEKVDQMVELEAKQHVPFPINEVAWNYIKTTSGATAENEAMLCAIRKEQVQELDDEMRRSKAALYGFDLAPAAIFNSYAYNYSDEAECVVILDLGARSTNAIFVEEGKFFIRNLLVGGSSVTNTIAKEFEQDFISAEKFKREYGFINQGGVYEAHEDPEIDGLSKVMRNAMTKIHGELLRTFNYYKAQQGGSPPTKILLAGGGALTPGVVEFFQEKFKLPVEIFNPLRNVTIGAGVDAALVDSNTPCMGDLVGMALRQYQQCPCELELLSESIESERDAQKRIPNLLLAGLCAALALLVGIVYYNHTTGLLSAEHAKISQEESNLRQIAGKIDQLRNHQNLLAANSGAYENAVRDRSYWLRLLAEINNTFKNDLIWITSVEILKDGKSMTPSMIGLEAVNISTGADLMGSAKTKNAAPAAPKYSLYLKGLYRQTSEGEQVVYQFSEDLTKSEFFDVGNYSEKKKEYVEATIGDVNGNFAYPFSIQFPLKAPIQFEFKE